MIASCYNYIRLSKSGLLQIRKEEKLGRKKLINVLESLLEYQNRNSKTGKISPPDETTFEVLKIAVYFAGLLDFKRAKNYKDIFDAEKITPYSFDELKASQTIIERQRYTLLLFTGLKDNDHFIQPKDLHINTPEVISCILQGTLVINESGEREIHKIPEREENNIVDLSTWTNELCVFSPERGFIFFNKETVEKVYEAGGVDADYEDYWKCIVRGVEYTVALRATFQMLEAKTKRMLKNIPEILHLFNSEKSKIIKIEDKTDAEKRLEMFAEDLANILKVLPPLRSIAIPTNAFRSGHSVQKFHHLNENCFNIKETLANIQQNIDELTNFLTFFKQLQMQIRFDAENAREANKDRLLNVTALIFTVTSILYVSFSFMVDGSDYLDKLQKAEIKLPEWFTIIVNLIPFINNTSPESISAGLYFLILFLIASVCVLYWLIRKLSDK